MEDDYIYIWDDDGFYHDIDDQFILDRGQHQTTRPPVNSQFANWKDSPCYSWLNPLFWLGHVQ